MPSFIAHGASAIAITKSMKRDTRLFANPLLYFLAIASAILPDADVISFSLGIPYSAPLGHRGFSHSIIYAIIWAAIITLIYWHFKKGDDNFGRVFALFFLVTVSHGLLDMFTSGGKGIGLFIPFHNERFFFPFRPIIVSPIGMDAFFSSWGMRVLISEFFWIILPSLAIYLIQGKKNKSLD